MFKRKPDLWAPVEVGRIAVWRSCHGRNALLLHGGPGLSNYLGALVDELGSSCDCLTYQQPAVSPTEVDGPLTIEAHVTYAAAVMDTVMWDSVLLVGHSWGALLALHVAAALPERVDGLVYLDGPGLTGDGGTGQMDETIAGRMSERLSPGQVARWTEIESRSESGEATRDEELESLRLAWTGYFPSADGVVPAPQMDLDPRSFRETWASMVESFDNGWSAAAAGSLSQPTLVIHGEGDPLPLAGAEEVAALVPCSTLEVLNGIGHFPWLEQPGIVRSKIERWVATEPRWVATGPHH
jgi:proline iminopeptidase